MQMIVDTQKLAEALLNLPVRFLRVRDLLWIEKSCDEKHPNFHRVQDKFIRIGNDILSQVEKIKAGEAAQAEEELVVEDKSLFGQIFGPSHRAKT